ncbi:hypothetical protein ACFQX4_22340 [Roseomonas sp. GCM10028921]
MRDRSKPGRAPTLTEAEQAVLLNTVFRGPNRAEDGGSDWTLPMLCRWIVTWVEGNRTRGESHSGQAERSEGFFSPIAVRTIGECDVRFGGATPLSRVAELGAELPVLFP